MINGETVLAVIPARGGSKRAPRKNIRPYRGKPLIEWAWEAAFESRLIDFSLLSTDDEEIERLAHPHIWTSIRPAHLATDEALNEDVLRDVLSRQESQWVVLLQPTSPLRTGADIDACILLAYEHGGAAVSYRPDGTKNGAVYVASAAWLKDNDFTNPAHARYTMPEERSLDIDYPADFDR